MLAIILHSSAYKKRYSTGTYPLQDRGLVSVLECNTSKTDTSKAGRQTEVEEGWVLESVLSPKSGRENRSIPSLIAILVEKEEEITCCSVGYPNYHRNIFALQM